MSEMNESRRALLKGLGLGLATCPFALGAARAETAQVTAAPQQGAASAEDRVSPYGLHQPGIATNRPAWGMVASFDAIVDTPADLERLLRRLTERIRFLTSGGAVPELDPKLPPADSGILGPVLRPDALTITLGLGASLFERHPWLAPHRPAQLARMTSFPNDALDADQCHGDIALQICANTQDTIIHALRDILKNLPDQLVLRWKQEGNVPVIAPQPPGVVESARNFLGFRDGSANPDPADAALMERVLWVQGPGWAAGGSYMAVRVIRNFVERWDRAPLLEQERIMGRTKVTGAPLDHPTGSEADTPEYAADPAGDLTPLDSHIRLANPRDAGGERHLMLRRPFNYSNGVTRSGQLDQGLLFIAYQASLNEGFIAAQTRLNGEPLEEYIKPVGGGYFFAPPGFSNAPDDYLGRQLIDAIGRTPSKT
ncbi:deferrochelatase/peroxidase EfeB [Rhodobacter aestuarii]|uniref:Deferrochelatase n=1 Tax=Rhodobacter aestuarii TaxID=453582 RepID=A0A1N7KY42_9RHOB|nr:iron uptake transporter deferrochelatase/peroxidase subunit [Rhodobacter aestuarii]PTV95506.1 deferrochelatase/peroxidase EfeB [Rhodobacter aestuarii]SIS66494.1 deferrochelatase/peroxidase EfeB [Rhodobacter aestuarii]